MFNNIRTETNIVHKSTKAIIIHTHVNAYNASWFIAWTAYINVATQMRRHKRAGLIRPKELSLMITIDYNLDLKTNHSI